jgi:hypothetical protein
MTPAPKTIQIFLPGGDPQGIRVAEITTRIVQVIEVPRSLLPEFLKMPESGQVALYFLIGESEDAEERRVYVGQTGDLRARLTSHNKEKDFWQRALILISRTNSLTQTHSLFLEWRCLQAIRAADRSPTRTATPAVNPTPRRRWKRIATRSTTPAAACWPRWAIRYLTRSQNPPPRSPGMTRFSIANLRVATAVGFIRRKGSLF